MIQNVCFYVKNKSPSIAQLVERRTVVVHETSLGCRLEGLFLTNLVCFHIFCCGHFETAMQFLFKPCLARELLIWVWTKEN